MAEPILVAFVAKGIRDRQHDLETKKNKYKKMNKRIEFIDLAKGLCISLVVAGHLFMDKERTNAYLFMSSFHMPLFFFLSGLFFSPYGSFKEFAIKKTNKLIIPFIAFYLLTFLFHISTNILQREQIDWDVIYKSILHEEIASNAPIWFLPCLFTCGLIFYLIVKVASNMTHHRIYCISTVSSIIGGVDSYLASKASTFHCGLILR